MNALQQGLFECRALIDGAWVGADNQSTFAVENPATGEVIAEVACCGRAETHRAINAAARAQKHWQRLTATERADHLARWHDLVLQNKSCLAKLLTSEQGKPLAEAEAEVAYGASYIRWFSEEARRVYGDLVPGPAADKRILCQREPVGVVACITPWNFPNAMLARKIAPALAAGCTVVCKPANETPLSALAMGELAIQAGIPAGVINILCGDTEAIGEALTSSETVRKLTFTGSTRVGKMLTEKCAGTMKRTTMELGGNAPFIVFEDADIDAAVAGLVACKFRNAGQTCVSANRVLVQESVYTEFVSRLVPAVERLKLGSGDDPSVEVGPLIHEAAAGNARQLINRTLAEGATRLSRTREETGCYIAPVVLGDVAPDMAIWQQEIFAPVAALVRFRTESEALQLANNTRAGLAAYVYTQELDRIYRVSEQLEFGMVGINEGVISNAMAPFGGIKESGNGREGGRYGLDDYLETKYLCLGGLDAR